MAGSRGFLRAVSVISEPTLSTVIGMGRPRIYEEPRISTAIRLPASLRDELHDAAAARDVSVNLLVTQAVSKFLRQLPPVGESIESTAS